MISRRSLLCGGAAVSLAAIRGMAAGDAGRKRIAAVVTTTIPRPGIDTSLLDGGLIDKVRHAADELSKRLNYRGQSSQAAGSKKTSYMKALGIK